jgi:O-antigen biosynthesis protein
MLSVFTRAQKREKIRYEYFDGTFYLKCYKDVAEAGIDPLTHYMQHGWQEGRNPSAAFHTLFYKDRNLTGMKFVNPLIHYEKNKFKLTLDIFPASDEQLIDVQKRVIEEQFDASFYRERYLKQTRDALDHYLRIGWRKGYEPNASFSTPDYLKAHPHIAVLNVSPFYHFITTREGGDLDVEAGRATETRAPAPSTASLERSRAETLKTIASEFDSDLYLRENSDVREAGKHPLMHYVDFGWREGRNPSKLFWTSYYLEKYEDVRKSGVNPFFHYITVGRKAGRKPNPIGLKLWELPVAPSKEDWGRVGAAKNVPDAVVDVIVPVYDGFDETLAAIHAVLANAQAAPFELVVVNDCSPSKALSDALRELDARGLFTYMENLQNLGFVRTVNRALALHPDRDVILLNADAIVHGDWIDRLLAHAKRDSKIATITPFSNNATICSYPQPDRDNYLALEVSAAELDDCARASNKGRATEIPTGVGFCFYMRRAILRQLGVLDEASFARGYGEENDYCMRALKAGFKNLFAHDIFVYHAGEISFADAATAGKAAGQLALRRKHPDFGIRLGLYQKADPASEARARLDLHRLAKHAGEKSALFITQAHGGGLATHVKDITRRLTGEGYTVVVMKVGGAERGSSGVAIECEGSPFFASLNRLSIDHNRETIARFIEWLQPKILHVHSFVGLEWQATLKLMEIVRSSSIAYYYTMHDYTPLCHRSHLVTAEGQYCGAPSREACLACLQSDWESQQFVEPTERERAYETFLVGAKRVFAPSRDAASRLKQRFPGVAPVLRPHPEPLPFSGKLASMPAIPRPLHVAALGAIGPHKGSRVLHALAIDAIARRLPIVFTVIGYSDIPTELEKVGVLQTGPYEDDSVAIEMLAEIQPHIVFYPSIWPETYCFTLSVALAAAVPAVVFDIGAPAERLRSLGAGQIIDYPLAKDPSALNDALLALPLEELWNNRPAIAPSGGGWSAPDYYGCSASPEMPEIVSHEKRVRSAR